MAASSPHGWSSLPWAAACGVFCEKRGKEKEEGKLTYTALFGLEKSKHELNCLLDKAYDILKKQNIESEIFNSIINSIREKV